PRLGTINVHGSLLPRYRGAAPIQWAVINGDEKTGITTMLTDIGMDTGDMLLKEEIEIPIDITAGELHDRMSELGAQTLLKTLKTLESGQLKRMPQNPELATHAPKIDKDTGWIQWHKTALQIHNLVRGTSPWPGAFALLNGVKMRIWKTELISGLTSEKEPGTILKVDQEGMRVQTGEGVLLIKEIQMESSKRMTPYQYAMGHPLKEGMKLNGKEV
ncbi:MAG: formyltransferase family protein, partial [Clostridia bacterium]|nr:formyltransferase family protein [Clostridia bacterium]